MIKKLGLLNIIFMLSFTTSAQAVYPAVQYVPDEIIVKFHGPTAEIHQKQLEDETLAKRSPSIQYLDRIKTKYKIKQIKPLIQDFQQRQKRLKSLHRKNKSLLRQKEKRILRRLKRANKQAREPDLSKIYRIKVDLEPGQSLHEVVKAYHNSPDVEYAELNHIVSLNNTPDDPLYSNQWSLENIGAFECWDTCTGSPDTIVAVIDTGVDYNHRDLKNNIWVNKAELNGIAGVDDDENGYIDDTHGYNFVYNNNDPMDDHGHGTHCSGIIAAEGNNELDITGLCWNSKIMALKFIGSGGEGTTADAVLAIYYAVANGADIISNSWGGQSKTDVLRDAIDYAYSQGVTIVAAAGNSDIDKPEYPAGYESVISVAAVDSNDNKWLLSNYGHWVDIAAPGVDIISLRAEGTSEGIPYNKYTTIISGTSMATPHVSGALALMLSANPLLTNYELYQKLVNSTDEIAPGICSSNGRLSVLKSIRAVVPSLGYVRFDQDYFAEGSSVGILIADWDLRSTGSQQVQLITRQDDLEKINLTESIYAFGVFTGEITTELEQPKIQDGKIQIPHGDIIHATYYDVNDGYGRARTSTDDAVADYQAPELLDVRIETRGPVAQIQLVTDELTQAIVRCGKECGGPYTFIQKDPKIKTSLYHNIRLQPVSLESEYFFIIDLIDTAGNKTIADNNGVCFAFTTPTDFQGFYVPGIYPTIQGAIDDASNGDTIWVADGTYSEEGNIDIDFKGKAITLKSENGPKKCIIDCQGHGRGFHFHNGEDANSVLDGFKIINGFGSKFGGGIRCTASSPTITNCIITGNKASDYGGGMYNSHNSCPTITNCIFSWNTSESKSVLGNGGGICNCSDSSPTITNCIFNYNSASYSGGGMYNYQNSSPIITNCKFHGNFTGWAGGGIINCNGSSPIITKCTFSENSAEGDGGGICNHYDSNPTINSSLFSKNIVEGYGGALKSYNSSAILINCNIYDNTAMLSGGGIWNGPDSSVKMTNCILWDNKIGNKVGELAQIQINISSDNVKTIINYNCIQGWSGKLGGIGNFDLDPLFVDPNNGDYHLKSAGWRWDSKRKSWHYDEVTSPCIDAGNPGTPLKDELLVVPDDPNNEWGINLRINMGIYGGTTEASLAPYNWSILADLNNNGLVNWQDFAWFANDWLTIAEEQFGDHNRDYAVDLPDLVLLTKDWMKYIKAPMVNIIKPENGVKIKISDHLPIEIEAEAWDINSSVVKVEFFVNNRKIGEDTDGSDGWNILWQDYLGGPYKLTAIATDQSGITTTSEVVAITVSTPR